MGASLLAVTRMHSVAGLAFLDRFEKFQAVHFRHGQIEQDQLEALAGVRNGLRL